MATNSSLNSVAVTLTEDLQAVSSALTVLSFFLAEVTAKVQSTVAIKRVV